MDLDFGLGTGAGPDSNMLAFAMSPVKTRSTNVPKATKFIRKMMAFDDFREEFIQRYAASLNEAFYPERLKAMLQE